MCAIALERSSSRGSVRETRTRATAPFRRPATVADSRIGLVSTSVAGLRSIGGSGLSRRSKRRRGDLHPNLPAPQAQRVAPLPPRQPAHRGFSPRLPRTLRQGARPPAPRRRARPARLHRVWRRGRGLRQSLVQHLQDELPDPVLLSRTEFLPVMREGALDSVGRVVARRGARARPASSRRADHAAAPASAVPEAPRASSRPVAMRCRGPRRAHQEAGRSRHAARDRGLDRHQRRPFAVACPPAHSHDRRRVLRRRYVPPPRDMGPRGADAALPRAAPGAAHRETRHLAGAGHQAHGLEASGLFSARRRAGIDG